VSERHVGLMIDHPGTRDRDDAIWVGREGAGWRVVVHVADVASAVRLGSADDIEACRRGSTRYLPDKTIGMLPRQIEARYLA
jgi:exoribonuclease R